MRFAFVDEAGISQRRQEPYAVVAGVVLVGDVQILELEIALEEIVARFPETHTKERFIHTAKLYGGYGEFHKAKGWTGDLRFSILDAVGALFAEHNVHIVWGVCDKSTLSETLINNYDNEHQAAHVMAAANCTLQIERYMREFCPDELTWIVAENNNDNRGALKTMHRFFAKIPNEYAAAFDHRWVPITRIRGTPKFEEKEDASHLQLADYCAFVIKRRMMGDERIERFFSPLRSQFPYGRSDTPNHPMFDPWEGN